MRGQVLAIVGAVLCVAASASAQADVWSSCQTITSVTDYSAYNSSFDVTFSPGASGCAFNIPGEVIFRVGQNGVTADSIKSLLATTMVAFAAGKPVMIYYDNTAAPTCFASIVAVNGYAAQCN